MNDKYELACQANDYYRRTRMNVKYYGAKLDRAKLIDTSEASANFSCEENPFAAISFVNQLPKSFIGNLYRPSRT